ncbi:MAG: hypothetical protein V4574_14000 [Pseudomonadota bacterium]
MAFDISQIDKDRWTDIRDAAYQVVLLTCRSDGFWALPTIPAEVHSTYSVPGAPEDKIRQADEFGSPSITVSYNALSALTAVLGEIPRSVASRTLAQIDTHRGMHGGYGSPTQRMNQREVNAVPRHTAMAVVSHLAFASGEAPAALRKHLEPSIRWLLDNQLKTGGWPYDWTNPPHALGFLSTASSICALRLYLDVLKVDDRRLATHVNSAILRGLTALAAEQKRGAWSGDGSPSDKQVRDSAFALSLLLRVNLEGQLNGLVPAFPNTVDSMVRSFSQGVLKDGWPKSAGENVPNIAASISALTLMIEAGDSGRVPPRTLASVGDFLTSSWNRDEYASNLTAWDWQSLAVLSGRIAGPLNRSKAASIENSCQRLRSKWVHGSLTAKDTAATDSKIRNVVTFALTSGAGFRSVSLKDRLMTLAIWTGKKVSEKLVVQAVITLLGLILAFILFGIDPIAYIGNLF